MTSLTAVHGRSPKASARSTGACPHVRWRCSSLTSRGTRTTCARCWKGPAVLNHNIETVRRVFKSVRAKGDYDLSLELLAAAGRSHPDIPTKSGVMVGLGETREELSQTMADLRAAGVDLLTVGQYLRPTRAHVQMDRFYHPSEFREIEEEGMALGFAHVASGPLVRSSYHADDQLAAARGVRASRTRQPINQWGS